MNKVLIGFRRSSVSMAALTLTGLLAGHAGARPIDEVIAAERSFADDAATLGVPAAFFKHAAPDAITFDPDPKPVAETFKASPNDLSEPKLAWWPLLASAASSGDIGFTTGPFTYGGKPSGYYFTVWKRQSDNTWRWIFDGGPPSQSTDAAPPNSTVKILASNGRGVGSAARALAQVDHAEARLAKAAKRSTALGYVPWLASDARLAGSAAPPVDDVAGHTEELARRPAWLILETHHREASAAGDFVWTYGDACWERPGQARRRGHFVRIWRSTPAGWRISFDELIGVPIESPELIAGACALTTPVDDRSQLDRGAPPPAG